MKTILIAGVLLAGVLASVSAEWGQEESRSAREAVKKSCLGLVAKERARLRDAYRAKALAGALYADAQNAGMIETLADFRKTLSEGELREIKKENIERKKLYAAGAGGSDVVLLSERKIEEILDKKLRAFSGRSVMRCADGSSPYETRQDPYEDERSMRTFPLQCEPWSSAEARNVGWHLGTPDQTLKRVTVYAVACAGPVEWQESHWAWPGVQSFREPACLVMDLLDGSLPAGPANQRGPAIDMVFYDEMLSDEASYIEKGLADWREKERVTSCSLD